MKRFIASYPVLFFGGLWGLTEATLGYVLHFYRTVPISGPIMIFFAVFYLLRAHHYRKHFSTFLYCGLIAAGIKLTNLFCLSQALSIYALKPAVYILAESFVVMGAAELCAYLQRNRFILK